MGKASEDAVNASVRAFVGIRPFPGREQSVHGRAPLHGPRSPSRASAAISSPVTPRADVFGGRGTAGRGAEGGRSAR